MLIASILPQYTRVQGPDLYQSRGNLNCLVEVGLRQVILCGSVVLSILPRAIKESLVLRASLGRQQLGPASLASEKCRTARGRDGNNGNLSRGQPGTIPTHCCSALSSDTTWRPRGNIPDGHALSYTLTRRRRSPKTESPESNTGLWPLGDGDDSRDSWTGVACAVFSQGLSLDVVRGAGPAKALDARRQ